MTIPYSSAELDVIQAFGVNPVKCADFWTTPEAVAVKSRAKSYFVKLQRRRCCYCRSNFETQHARVWDLEHVAPRARYPHFMFEEKNLAVSCISCNESKGDQDTLINGSRLKRYPSEPARFKIIHPHYDIYSDHLAWSNRVVPFPRTEKGKVTIYVCDLMRFALRAFDAAGSLTERRFEVEVDLVMSAEPMPHEKAAAAAAINEAIFDAEQIRRDDSGA